MVGSDIAVGRQERSTVLALAVCQALFQTGSIILFTIGGLAGLALAPSPALATVPIATTALGAAFATVPAALLMARRGRKAGFLLGTALGVLGGGVGAAAMANQNFELLCIATMLVGTYQGFAQYYRFAASEVASAAYRSKAISYVIAGGVFAAVAGPYLAVATKEVAFAPSYAGPFAVVTLLSVAAALVLIAIRLPREAKTLASDRQTRNFRELARQPAFIAAVGSAALAYAVMGIPMTATPMSMVMHAHSVDSAAMVIQWHVLGMTAPSFFTGSLIRRFGVEQVMLAGTAALGAHVAISSVGTEFAHYGLSLLVLGVGWNFLFVGATSLLTEAHADWEKAKVQGFNDLVVILVLTLGSFSAGPLHDLLGWRGLNLAMLPLIAIAASLITRSMLRRSERASEPV